MGFAHQAHAAYQTTAPSGQAIYYEIYGNNEVRITYPNYSNNVYWYNRTTPVGVLVIPDSITYQGTTRPVTAIGAHAFEDCDQLTSVTIPYGVTLIGEDAFYYCSNLTSVSIPNSVTDIGQYAFSNCTYLSSITILNSVTNIKGYTFQHCSSLITVNIPSSVTYIYSGAFQSCYSLSDVYISATNPPYLQSNAFASSSTTIHIPCGSTQTYLNAYGWSGFNASRFVEFGCNTTPDSVTITTTVVNSQMGSVTPGGTYPYGNTELFFTATPNNGYAFLSWQDGGNDNPRTIVPTADTVLTAFFYPVASASDTVIITLTDTVTRTISVTDTVTLTQVDTVTLPQYDTISVGTSHDTLLLQQYVHRTTITNILTRDTTVVEDSLYVNNFLPYPEPRVDTLTVYSDTLTLTELVHDTVTLTPDTVVLFDTVTNNIVQFDTVTVTQFDTIAVTQFDTVTLYADTVTITEVVHDTTTVTVYADTLTLTQFDTVTVYADTLAITLFDTITVYADTLTLTQFDTVTLTQYDTITVYADTLTLTQFDTITVTQYDTVTVDNYIHDTTTVTITVHDTVTVDNYIHDTTTVTVTLTDTVYLTVTDTVYTFDSIAYDTVYISHYVHDTITINEAVTYHLLSVMSNNAAYGIAAGSGQFPDGSQVEIAAIPMQGYHFVSWSDGSTDNPHTISLDEDSYYIATLAQSTQGINNPNSQNWWAYAELGTIVVKGENLDDIQIYDEVGRLLKSYTSPSDAVRFMVPASGVYFVRVAGSGAKRVVVIR